MMLWDTGLGSKKVRVQVLDLSLGSMDLGQGISFLWASVSTSVKRDQMYY